METVTRAGSNEASRIGTTRFAIEVLAALRHDRFKPAAWVRFFGDSWERSLDDIRAEPSLVRSCWSQSALLATLATAVVVARDRDTPPQRFARRWLGVVAALLVQQLFVALHLGMTHNGLGEPRYRGLGLANFLTLLRGLCAALLIDSDGDPAALFTLVFSMGALTDAVDGIVARRTATVSRMGQMLDPMADVVFYAATVRTAARRGVVPRWFSRLVLARFFVPIVAGGYRYFLRVEPMDSAHTRWGKAGGFALTLLPLIGLRWPRAAGMLCVPASVLLGVAAGLQIRRAIG